MPRLGMAEILIIAFVLMVFFGANRIPDMMRGLARGLRGFKEELKAEEKPDAEAGSEGRGSQAEAKPHPGAAGSQDSDSGEGQGRKNGGFPSGLN